MTDLAIQSMAARHFCAEYSLASGEDLAGTVKSVECWLLIEYRGRPERDALSVFPAIVRRRLNALRARLPGLRLAIIRRADRTSGLLTLLQAFPSERAPRLYRSEFSRYEDISFDGEPAGETSDHFFAVCTHGTHDPCCARFGNRVYSGMSAMTDSVWQISHIGGCRFAPNVLCLPHGIVYGRVDTADCRAIVSSYLNDQIYIPKLRGRSCYSRPVQAAERFLRAGKNLLRIDDLTLVNAEEAEGGRWRVTFRSANTAEHTISLITEHVPGTYKSCAADELSPRQTFRLTECT